MSNDKFPPLPPRPKSFRAKTFDPYDDVFGYDETKAHMDTQDARIATLVAEAEISDERVTEYRDANRGLGKRPSGGRSISTNRMHLNRQSFTSPFPQASQLCPIRLARMMPHSGGSCADLMAPLAILRLPAKRLSRIGRNSQPTLREPVDHNRTIHKGEPDE